MNVTKTCFAQTVKSLSTNQIHCIDLLHSYQGSCCEVEGLQLAIHGTF